MQRCINYVWFDRPRMFNMLLNGNVLRIIRIKCVIRSIRNTRIKQLSSYYICTRSTNHCIPINGCPPSSGSCGGIQLSNPQADLTTRIKLPC